MSVTLTEAEMLDDIVSSKDGGLETEAARAILELGLPEKRKEHIRQLPDAKNKDDLSAEDGNTLNKYLRVGQLVDLLQAKARLSFTS